MGSIFEDLYFGNDAVGVENVSQGLDGRNMGRNFRDKHALRQRLLLRVLRQIKYLKFELNHHFRRIVPKRGGTPYKISIINIFFDKLKPNIFAKSTTKIVLKGSRKALISSL